MQCLWSTHNTAFTCPSQAPLSNSQKQRTVWRLVFMRCNISLRGIFTATRPMQQPDFTSPDWAGGFANRTEVRGRITTQSVYSHKKNKLYNSMQNISSWEANSRLADKEISHSLMEAEGSLRCSWYPATGHFTETNLLHTLTHYSVNKPLSKYKKLIIKNMFIPAPQ
jgi:hypothetical protein